MQILEGDLDGEDLADLLRAHMQSARKHSRPGNVHALDLTALRGKDILFWTARTQNSEIMGCAALKFLTAHHGEIKSMRTANTHLRKGVATKLLSHAVKIARERKLTKLSLETGTMASYAPARSLYKRFGFRCCEPFSNYSHNEFSLCMSLRL